jgi:cell division transport system permease protein
MSLVHNPHVSPDAGMKRFYQRAIKDILGNRFLTTITVITIALSIMIASAFALFFINAGEVLNIWKKGVRMMVYLTPDLSEAARLDTRFRLQAIDGVQEARYVSKQDALERLKEQMKHHSALLDNLKSNPLPDSFEVLLEPRVRTSDALQFLAERISTLTGVEEVEYGQQWIQRFANIINLFSLAGYAIGGLFFMAAVFIVANTIRLVLYSRRDEIEIMRLVGATDRFIKIPFYMVGMIQGGVGSLAGLSVLLIGYYSLTMHFGETMRDGLVTIRFFPPTTCLAIIVGGVLVGWLGCWISLKQFLKA